MFDANVIVVYVQQCCQRSYFTILTFFLIEEYTHPNLGARTLVILFNVEKLEVEWNELDCSFYILLY